MFTNQGVTYEKAMVAAANISSVRKTMAPLEYIRTLPNLSIIVRIAMVTDICAKVVRNQANQWTELFKPIIFIT